MYAGPKRLPEQQWHGQHGRVESLAPEGIAQVVVGCKNAGSEEDYLGAGSVYRLSDGYALCTFEMLYTMPIFEEAGF